MSAQTTTQVQQSAPPALTPVQGVVLQRTCACGQHTIGGGECETCRKKRTTMVQRAPRGSDPTGGLPGVTAPSSSTARQGHDFSRVRVHAREAEAAPGLAISQPGDRHEQEAERAAAQVMRGLEAPVAGDASDPASLSHAAPSLQRAVAEAADAPAAEAAVAPAEAAAEESAAPETAAVPGLLVENDVADAGPGQLRQDEFLAQLRAEICAATESILAAVGRTSDGCPYLDSWFGYYGARSARHLERAIRRYAPETAGASAARDYIPPIVARIRRAVAVWAATGEITGVPEGVSPTMAAEAAAGSEGAPAAGAVALKPRDGAAPGSMDPRAIRARLGPGRALDSGVRAQMEAAFGQDFSTVRVHMGARAADVSAGLNARAFTLGRDVAFGAGEYQPGTPIGDALIAHELAHVVQQGGASGTVAPLQVGATGYNALEEDADLSAVGAVAAVWGGATGALKEIARNAKPRLRSGLRLSRCNGDSSKRREETSAKDAAAPATSGSADAGGQQPPTTQNAPPAPKTPIPPVPTTACTSAVDADKVIIDHRVDPTVIEKPGDKVTFTATFACQVKGDGFSKLMAPDGTEFGRKSFKKGLGQLTYGWDGKKQFKGIGTYLVDDGDYFHRIEPIKYAIKGGKDQFTSGPNHDSPTVKVKVRSYKGPGTDHFHFTTANVDALAEIIQSEIGVGNSEEKKAVAWCVRNQMIRMGTGKVTEARDHFGDAHDQAATPADKTIAEEILKKPMSDDIASGAIKWFSPRSMPKKGESCVKKDCGGGLVSFTDDAGKASDVFTPSWHKTMTHVAIAGVRDWYLRVYKL